MRAGGRLLLGVHSARHFYDMKTKEFVDMLRAAPDKRLLIVNSEDQAVHSGYHLTEIKAVSYDTVDCGGQTNRWSETVLQLWVPEEADDDFMKAGKFARIFDSVRASVPLREDTDVRIEYGDDNFFSSVYDVCSITADADTVRVLLEPPRTTCKARDRRTAGVQADTCCS
jgi:uncharacterized protein DUF6428